MNSKKIGFIGLGIMGAPMAINLINAGYDLVVFDTDPQKIPPLASKGASVATSGKNVAMQCNIIITMLPNWPHVKAAVFNENGILEGLQPNSILIDMSSITPQVSQEICAELEKVGCEMLDAPVSGGEPKAISGELSIMVGGKKEVFDKVKPILDIMSSTTVLCGGIGAGNTTKLVNQIIVAVNIAALSEGLVLGKKAGVDPKIIFEAIRKGLAGSTVMEAKAPMMINGNFDPGFRVELHIKDMENILQAGHQVGAPLPLSSHVMEILQWLRMDGRDKEDHSSIIRYYEALAKATVRETPDYE